MPIALLITVNKAPTVIVNDDITIVEGENVILAANRTLTYL